jgi:hypothetical protein
MSGIFFATVVAIRHFLFTSFRHFPFKISKYIGACFGSPWKVNLVHLEENIERLSESGVAVIRILSVCTFLLFGNTVISRVIFVRRSSTIERTHHPPPHTHKSGNCFTALKSHLVTHKHKKTYIFLMCVSLNVAHVFNSIANCQALLKHT